MNKTCTSCQATFEVTASDLQFYESIGPIFNGQKYAIPPPTHCPDCRQQRRLSHCNERNLYNGTCGLCQKAILTEYSPGSGYPYYCKTCWHSDKWDTRDYGREYDFNRPFFEQIDELRKTVPSQGLLIDSENPNAEYIHWAGSSKNCYLISHADFCENCCYGYGFKKNISCMDGFYNLHCELCYDCVDVHKSYNLIASQDCTNCSDSAFLRDCIGVRNSFLCVGLREKEYCFMNKQLTKEEYEQKMAQIDLGSYRQYQSHFQQRKELEAKHHFKEFQGHNLQNCSGNYLANCKDCENCFDIEDGESLKHCSQLVLGAKNCQDIYQYGTNLQQSYECICTGANSYHILFSFGVNLSSNDLYYCWYAEHSSHCFGSMNLNGNKYCILNKQYSESDYNTLVPKIIEHMKSTGEWGEHFPSSISPFGYNKTTAQLYYPLSKESATHKGLKWDDYEPPLPNIEKVIPAEKLPDNLADIPNDILNWAIRCAESGKLFRIVPLELNLYRKMKLPIPRLSPELRHLNRFKLRTPRKLTLSECDKCHCPIQTGLKEGGTKRSVYCERCYKDAMY